MCDAEYWKEVFHERKSPDVIKTYNEYRRRYGPDCTCTVDQVKTNTCATDCEWCNDLGMACNPDLSDPEVEHEEDRV